LFDVKAAVQKGKTSLIDVSDFFKKRICIPKFLTGKECMSLSAMAADRSFVKSFASYPINAEIKMLRTYSARHTVQMPGRPRCSP
jgi:metal-dependent HD superfamily phosphatase/phosphodiesterase